MSWVRDRLIACFGRPAPFRARSPIGQLVKSSISGRTRDETSLAAYRRLVASYRSWSALADASPDDIEAVIADVTFPDVKARHLSAALRAIESCHPDFDLRFLNSFNVVEALTWLERLPGVGRKVAASTLNFSKLHMPSFVIDTHVLRILRRWGFVRSKADTRTAYDTVMTMTVAWSAADLAELHILMKRLGQIICRADCACCCNCPVSRGCKAGTPYLRGAALA